MIFIDTSIWVDHLNKGDKILEDLLEKSKVLCHPFVIGELACGNLANRTEILSLLDQLPKTLVASDSEVLFFIENNNLNGKGIGYIDAHLLASVSLSRPAQLWTRDKRLAFAASELGLL